MLSPFAPASTPVSSGFSSPGSRIGLLFVLVLCAFTSLAWITTASAGAVTDSEELGQFGSEGTGAGQFNVSYGMASDPFTGHLFVADLGNQRIDEFTAWGEFVKAWGWGVADGNGELETCTVTCLKGIEGSGKGQFKGPFSVAIDSSGNVYILDFNNERVQKFDSSGQFVLMFGGGVDKTTGGNVCTAASGDECQTGTSGSGAGEFSEGTGLAINQVGTILVGGAGRIQEFEPDGSFKSEFKVPGTVFTIAPDPTGSDLYAIFNENKDVVHKFSSAGTELSSLKVHEPRSIAIDAEGNIYVVKGEEKPRTGFPNGIPEEVIEFNSGEAEVSSCCAVHLPSLSLTSLATNTVGDLYIFSRHNSGVGSSQYISLFGPPPVIWPPPRVPPGIVAQFPSSVDSTSATLKAQINPNHWADTRYYLEYGLADCASDPCAQSPASPGVELGAGAVKKAVTSSGVVLTGLVPGTTYHYHFVAESGGGGPVIGPDRTFTTFAAGHPAETCANEAFRTGLSVNLPDCRAYEMVSPVDKSNGDIITLPDITGWETRLNQSAIDGEALTYSSYRAFGGPEGAPWTAQYMARRGAEGWRSEALGGPLTGTFYGSTLLENEFKAFSPDLCQSWVLPAGESTLAPGQVAGFPNLYRRENCPKSYEALTTVVPPSIAPSGYYPELQGFSANGAKAIFRVNDKLSKDAREGGAFQVYEAAGGTLKPVCVFPEGTSAKVEAEFPNCSAGSPSDLGGDSVGRVADVSHAMSDDGSRVYWSASGEQSSLGKIYLRLNGTTTLPVTEAPGEGQTTKPAQFWGASADGARALYVVADPDRKSPTPKDKSLYLYDLGVEESTLIAPKVTAVVATSEDLSRVYFVSEAVLAGTTGASAGEENLYLHEAGGNVFVATLSGRDVESSPPSDGSVYPVFHAARATPDGVHLAFVSTERLTGFDNTDLESGEADSEVFSYDAMTGKLVCASCSPAGARPAGRNIAAQANTGNSLWTAASLPAPQTELNAPRALSDDGSRLFFTSYADLLPADTNGKADVYEWEAVGSGSCKDESDPDYHPANGGCLFLISSGESPSDSELVDTGGHGRDVFFTTNASLLPQDTGLIDLYDARIDGGFPSPSAPPAACEGEACQGAPVPPLDRTPASFAFSGPGNPRPPVLSALKAKAKPRVKSCGKGRVRKKGKCVKKKRSVQQGSVKRGKAGKSSRIAVKRNGRASR